MMVVEGADRFGLAQLHQLRGRVGAGTVASFCVLVSTAAEGTTELERLKAVACDDRRVRARRAGLRAAARGRRARPRAERPAAPPGRDAREPRPPRAGRPRPDLRGGARRRGRRARRWGDRRWPTSSPPAGCATCSPATRPARPDGLAARTRSDGRCGPRDRGDGARASGWTRPVRARGRSPTGSSRRCSRSWSRTSTGRAVARPVRGQRRAAASRPCRAARGAPSSSSSTPPPHGVIDREPAADRPRRSRTRWWRGTRSPGSARLQAPPRPDRSTSSSSTRRTRTRPRSAGRSSSSAPAPPGRPGRRPSTSGATRPPARIGLLASARRAPLRGDALTFTCARPTRRARRTGEA